MRGSWTLYTLNFILLSVPPTQLSFGIPVGAISKRLGSLTPGKHLPVKKFWKVLHVLYIEEALTWAKM